MTAELDRVVRMGSIPIDNLEFKSILEQEKMTMTVHIFRHEVNKMTKHE